MVMRIDAVRVSLLSVRVCVVSVGMTAVGLAAVTVVVEEEETDNVGQEAARTDDEDDDRVGNVLRLDEALDGLEEDRETQRDKEDAVDEGPQGFRALPLLQVSIAIARQTRGFLLRMCMSSSWSFG